MILEHFKWIKKISNIKLILKGPITSMLWKLGFPNIIAWLAWTISTFADAFLLVF